MSLTPRIAETAKEAVEELKSTIYYDYLHGLDHHHPRPRRSSTKHSVQPHYQGEHLLRCPLKRDRLTRNNRELHLAAYFCLCISTIGRFSLTKPFRYLGFCFKYTISFIYFSLFHTHSNIHSARLFTQKYQLYYFSVTIHLSIHPLSTFSARPSLAILLLLLLPLLYTWWITRGIKSVFRDHSFPGWFAGLAYPLSHGLLKSCHHVPSPVPSPRLTRPSSAGSG